VNGITKAQRLADGSQIGRDVYGWLIIQFIEAADVILKIPVS
jgi:hypothetical protein